MLTQNDIKRMIGDRETEVVEIKRAKGEVSASLWEFYSVFATQENGTTTQELARTTQEDVHSVADEILALIKEKAGIASGEVAEKLGTSRDGVKYYIEKLKKSVGLVHEGATEKVQWIVVNT